MVVGLVFGVIFGSVILGVLIAITLILMYENPLFGLFFLAAIGAWQEASAMGPVVSKVVVPVLFAVAIFVLVVGELAKHISMPAGETHDDRAVLDGTRQQRRAERDRDRSPDRASPDFNPDLDTGQLYEQRRRS